MEKLLIGDVIYRLRKEKGITQEQLANFIGVSTAAVSKWESGNSYPDITLLPIIATIFNVTIDMLLNFKIELSDEEVMKIYSECESIFSSNNLEKAIEMSKSYISKYPGSYYLKSRIGFLFSMYSWKRNSEESSMDMIKYSMELFEDVAQNCSKSELVEAALFQLGSIYSIIGKEDKAIATLNKIPKSQCDPNMILASIYSERNEFKKSRELLQSKLYQSINNISLVCMGLANSYFKEGKDLKIVERYYSLIIDIKNTLSHKGDLTLPLSMDYLNFAQYYLELKDKKKGIKMLNKMIEDIRVNDINKLDNITSLWCFNEIKVRPKTITMNLYENIFKIFEHSDFDIIRENEEFIKVINDLKVLEKVYINKV